MVSIAIDGPAGAGKSTVAKRLSQDLGYVYLDTGALYRGIGVAAKRRNLSLSDESAVEGMLKELSLTLDYDEAGLQHVYVNGEDVTGELRQSEMSMAASKVSALPCVRTFLLKVQRNAALCHNIIMDGRDIGTVILPNATLKIFLTAKAEERARRRMLDLARAGYEVNFEELLTEIRQRDYNDSHRAVAPLCAAEDAVTVDSTNLSFEETVEAVKKLLEQRLSVIGGQG